ncbi:hypothetical protein RM629_03990 [Staphylococcus chromogenes]|uniref:hypothetical protein n=1 Tax=Staphylococcus chromogenes TaxID=46126 RepID=UPI002884DBAF|nr:hypothetical protein [Staphylococcus chromogenes]MDT0715391.1 hypothetical protein [Staphylococcus chromogenes]
MVKIKVKKEMELPELLRWASDNDIKNDKIKGDQGSTVYFNKNGWVSTPTFTNMEENFEVEIEQEITEETVIPKLIEFCDDDNDSTGLGYFYNTKTRINDVKDHDSIAFYMLNDNMTMTLLWKGGGMVE